MRHRAQPRGAARRRTPCSDAAARRPPGRRRPAGGAEAARALAAIAALPPGQRDAVTLFYLADLSHAPDRRAPRDLRRRGQDAPAQGARLAADPPRRPPKGPPARDRHVPMHVADVRDTGGDDLRPATSSCSRRRAARGAADLDRRRRGDHARAAPARRPAAAARHLPLRRRPLAAAGASLREVRVVRLAETIFYAEAVLEDGASVDARPATRSTSRSWPARRCSSTRRCWTQAASDEREMGDELAAALGSPRDARVIAEEFRDRAAGG